MQRLRRQTMIINPCLSQNYDSRTIYQLFLHKLQSPHWSHFPPENCEIKMAKLYFCSHCWDRPIWSIPQNGEAGPVGENFYERIWEEEWKPWGSRDACCLSQTLGTPHYLLGLLDRFPAPIDCLIVMPDLKIRNKRNDTFMWYWLASG